MPDPLYEETSDLGWIIGRLKEYFAQLGIMPDRAGGISGTPSSLIPAGGERTLVDVYTNQNFNPTTKAGWILLVDSTKGLARFALQNGVLTPEGVYLSWAATNTPLLNARGIFIDTNTSTLKIKLGPTATPQWVQWWFTGKNFT